MANIIKTVSLIEFKSRINFGKWVDRLMDLASQVATWSARPIGRQHGCVLAVDGRFIVATGYNGTAAGEPPCACDVQEIDVCPKYCCPVVHGEINAIVNAAKVNAPLERCVAYLTKAPCLTCRSALKNAGVVAMVWSEGNEQTGAFPRSAELFSDEWPLWNQ